MADTTLATASQIQKWDAKFFAEYVRNSGFSAYMGRSPMMPIIAKYELTDAGRVINIPLVTKLSGAGVTGSTALEGAEEALNNYNFPISIAWKRNGVLITKDQQHWTEMDLRMAARDMLDYWASSGLRTDIIAAMKSKWETSGSTAVAYGSATEAQKDLWLDRNNDRVVFGSALSNVSTSAPAGGATRDHSASLSNVDSTNDKLSRSVISLLKRRAKAASPGIRPIRVNDGSGREYFVAFTGSLPFRDLKLDLDSTNANARPRDVGTNPIFQDGDLEYDGVIIREIPEMAPISGVGASSIAVGEVFLCGAQALAVAWGQEPKSTTDVRDYGFRKGVGIEEARGVQKLVFNGVDHGMVTGYVSALGD
jgi:N4-gp56 family major capsid protein